MFENHGKCIIQHCERSDLRLHFECTKAKLSSQKLSNLASLWKLGSCGQTVIPDTSILKGQKLVKKVKWVILGYFQKICIVGQVYIYLKSPDESFRVARKRYKTKKYCAENAIMYVLLSSRG